MGLDERLVEDHKKADLKKNEPDPYYESEPDGYMYMNRKRTVPLDKNKGIFADSNEKSLNLRPSVFDETAIFKTGNKE